MVFQTEEQKFFHVNWACCSNVEMTRKGRDGRGVALKNITKVIEYVLESKNFATEWNILIEEGTDTTSLISKPVCLPFKLFTVLKIGFTIMIEFFKVLSHFRFCSKVFVSAYLSFKSLTIPKCYFV